LGVSLNKTFYHDLDNDGKDEILISTVGSANYKDSLSGMHDHSAYILALDHKLDFCFKPVEFPGDFTFCLNFPYIAEGISFIGSFIQSFGSEHNIIPQVQIRDINGKLLYKRLIGNQFRGLDCSILPLMQKNGKTKIAVIIPDKGISILGSNLEDKKATKLKTGKSNLAYAFDADCDGDEEIITHGINPGEFYIFRNDLSHKVVFNVDPEQGVVSFQNILRGKENPGFLMQKGNHWYTYEYGFNPSFYWQYPFYLATYLSVLLFILMIRNLQRIQLRKKYETEKKMAELQLLSLRNQMDPHFTFNVLNTIGSVILQNKGDESYDLLMKFSKMIRTTINSANKICRPLTEELNFVKNYLELQQFRHAGYFIYQIAVDPEVNTQQPVPKMILQTYVENALKHGIIPRKGGGELLISVKKVNTCLELSVQDNGIGRRQAKINGSTSTGVGLSILNQYYQVLNRDNINPITEEFIDLTDEHGHPAGTRVVVCIPEGFVFPGISLSN
jgi:hypothetical protein